MARKHRVVLAAVLGVALLLRLLLLFGQSSDVLFAHPVLDEQRYVDAARSLASGGPGEDQPFWQPPGIIYVLTASFAVAGPGLWLPHVLQVLVSTASCLLLFVLGRRLFDVRVGLLAAAIGALHGGMVFASYELLPATWIVFFDLLAIWALLRAGARRSGSSALVAGLTLGVAAVFSPTILPFAAAGAAWLWWRSSDRGRRRWLLAGALIAGAILPIAPVTWRNYRHGGELVLVSTNAGLNFYIGNNPRYHETFALRPGREWIELTREPSRHGATKPGEGSRYFLRKGLSFFREEPGSAAALLMRKAYLTVHAAEIPRDTDIYAVRDDSVVIALLVWPGPVWFPGVLVIPLALFGIAWHFRDRGRLLLPYAFLVVQAGILIAFFVSARHRAPALAVLFLFAGAGVFALVDHWRKSRGWRRAAPIAALALVALLISLPVREAGLSQAGERDFYRGIAHQKRKELTSAVLAFRAATRKNPRDARAWFELGNALVADDRGDDAVDAWQRASRLDPADSRPRRRAAMALMRANPRAAAKVLIENIEGRHHEPAHYAPDHLNLAFLLVRGGQQTRALEHLRAAAAADPAYCRTKFPGFTRALVAAPAGIDPSFFGSLAQINRELGLEEAARAAEDAGR